MHSTLFVMMVTVFYLCLRKYDELKTAVIGNGDWRLRPSKLESLGISGRQWGSMTPTQRSHKMQKVFSVGVVGEHTAQSLDTSGATPFLPHIPGISEGKWRQIQRGLNRLHYLMIFLVIDFSLVILSAERRIVLHSKRRS